MKSHIPGKFTISFTQREKNLWLNFFANHDADFVIIITNFIQQEDIVELKHTKIQQGRRASGFVTSFLNKMNSPCFTF